MSIYNTSSSTSNIFYMKPAKLEIPKNTFPIAGAKLWNEIPWFLRELPKTSFKLTIKNMLLSVVKEEDSFIEVHKIVSIYYLK